MKMNMIEGWKNLRAVTGRHEFRDLVHTRPVVDMAVGIDDLHMLGSLYQCAYNKRASPLSTIAAAREDRQARLNKVSMRYREEKKFLDALGRESGTCSREPINSANAA
jgi:hypothetical protein